MTTFLIEGVRAFAFEDVEDLVFGEVQILHLDRLDTCFGFEHKEAAAAAGMGVTVSRSRLVRAKRMANLRAHK
jgi:hypothetical protein